MDKITISGKVRTALGKKDCKALRADGMVPCVIYGGEAPVHFYAHENEFRNIVFTPNVYIIDLNIDGTVYQTIKQDIQFHPVTDSILHIDFLQVSDDKAVKIDVPVRTKGFAKGVQSGGKMQLELRYLRLSACPKDLPNFVEIDVTDIELGGSFRVGELELEGVECLNSKSVPVVRVVITRAARAAMNAAKGDE